MNNLRGEFGTFSYTVGSFLRVKHDTTEGKGVPDVTRSCLLGGPAFARVLLFTSSRLALIVGTAFCLLLDLSE
jgi:hypothetical protein